MRICLTLVALFACDDGAQTGDCFTLGENLAVGESSVDREACIRCTCHAPGETGCVPIEGCGVGDGFTPDAERPRDVGALTDLPLDAAEDASISECPDAGRRCHGGNVLVCEGGELTEQACPAEQACRDGFCVADCDEGARRCTAGTPEICQDQAWMPGEACRDLQVCREGRCLSPECLSASQQRTSYVGCEFLAVQTPNLDESDASPVGLVVANFSLDQPARIRVLNSAGAISALVPEARVTDRQMQQRAVVVHSALRDHEGNVTLQGMGQAERLEIPPGGTATLLLPHGQTRYAGSGGIFDQSAWLLQADSPVVAYQFAPFCCNFSYTNDASLLYPTKALGNAYDYIGVPSWAGRTSAMIVVAATEDDTEVEVHTEARLDLRPGGGVVLRDGVARGTLQARQVMVVAARSEAGMDLTGAQITTSAPAAVFTSHMCSFYPQDQGACDHLEEQLMPSDTLGHRFLLVPTLPRGPEDHAGDVTYFKLAGPPGTTVTFAEVFEVLDALPPGAPGVRDCAHLMVDAVSLVLDERGHCEFGTAEATRIEADAPITVLGILAGEQAVLGALPPNGTVGGDPSIFLVPPDLQYRRDYTFLVPGTYENDYVTVIAERDAIVELDGEEVAIAEGEDIPGTQHGFVHIRLEDGPHRLAGNRPFAIIVFAYDRYVSYAFAGGLDLGKR